MNFRKMITAIELLAVTGVMSVGFSTWVIVETSFPEIQVKVETENVVNVDEYLKIKNVIFSDYNTNGFYTDFVYGDTTDNLTGYLEFDIEVDLSMCTFISGNLEFEIGISTLVASKSSFDLVGFATKISREESSYVISDNSSTSGSVSKIDDLLEDNIRISNPSYATTINDVFSIAESNRQNMLTISLKYGFTIESSDLSTLCTLNGNGIGIKTTVTALVREGGN